MYKSNYYTIFYCATGSLVRVITASTFVHTSNTGSFVRVNNASTFVHAITTGSLVRVNTASSFVHSSNTGSFFVRKLTVPLYMCVLPEALFV